MSSGVCEVASSPAAACTLSGSTLTVTFTLNQVSLLSDSTVLTSAVDSIDDGLYITFAAKSKRRKRSTTLTQSGSSSATSVTCASGSQEVNGTCLQCSAGYGMVSVSGSYECQICQLGYYSDSKGTSVCSECATGKSTLATGSTSASNCTSDYCVVPTTPPHSGMIPPTNSRLTSGTTITLYCEDGYSVEFGAPNTYKCDGTTVFPPLCYSKLFRSGKMVII